MISPQAIFAVIRINLWRRPLWRDALVQEALGINRRKFQLMVEDGSLPWAWDIGQGQRNRELRVLGYSVLERQSGPMPGIGESKDFGLAEVLRLILPQVRPSVRGIELQRILWTSANNIQKYEDAGELAIISGDRPKTGPNSTARYTRASVEQFLKERRVL